MGEIIVAVMVVNLLEMSLHMKYSQPADLVFAALAVLLRRSARGAALVLHEARGAH